MVMGIGYNDDIDKARSIMEEVINNDKRILKEPAYKIAVIIPACVSLFRLWQCAAGSGPQTAG